MLVPPSSGLWAKRSIQRWLNGSLLPEVREWISPEPYAPIQMIIKFRHSFLNLLVAATYFRVKNFLSFPRVFTVQKGKKESEISIFRGRGWLSVSSVYLRTLFQNLRDLFSDVDHLCLQRSMGAQHSQSNLCGDRDLETDVGTELWGLPELLCK